MNTNRKSLLEATILALQGNLVLDEDKKSKRMKKESIDVSLDNNGSTFVDTDDATVIVQPKNCATIEYTEVPVAVDVPVETVIQDTPVEIETDVEVQEEIPIETEEIETNDEIDVEDEEVFEESKKLKSTQDHCTKTKKEEVGAAAMLGAAALAGLAPAVTKRVQDVLGSIPGNVNEEKELKTEVIVTDSPEGMLKMIYDYYKETGMELNFFDDLINTTSITTDEVKKWFEQSELEESKIEESKVTKTESLKDDLKELNSGLYDYIANNYYKLSNDELKELALNAVYVADNDSDIISETLSRLEENKNKSSKGKFSSKSFSKVIENYLKENNKVIESFKVTKLNRSNKGLKIEGTITTTKNLKRTATLEFKKIQENGKFTKYTLAESKQLKLENKSKNKIIMVTNNKDNILECKYLRSK